MSTFLDSIALHRMCSLSAPPVMRKQCWSREMEGCCHTQCLAMRQKNSARHDNTTWSCSAISVKLNSADHLQALYHKIWKYCQSSSRAHAEIPPKKIQSALHLLGQKAARSCKFVQADVWTVSHAHCGLRRGCPAHFQ